MLDCRGLQIFDGFFVALCAKIDDFIFQQMSLIGHVRRMTIQTISLRGLVPESRIRKLRAQALVTIQAHLRTRRSHHPGNIPTVRIVAGGASSGGKRPMGEAALELIFLMAFKTDRFRRRYKLRRPAFRRDLVAEFAEIVLGQQTIQF